MRVFSTVSPGDQVDTELCSRKGEKIFEERKDTTLSGKLVKNPPVCRQFGEARIELREGYRAKKQRPYENHGQKHEILRKVIERNLREFGWLEGFFDQRVVLRTIHSSKTATCRSTHHRWLANGC